MALSGFSKELTFTSEYEINGRDWNCQRKIQYKTRIIFFSSGISMRTNKAESRE